MNKPKLQSLERKILIYSIAAAAMLILGELLIVAGIKHGEDISINYEEKSSIDYKVYLKPNKFFEEPYLPAGRTYITSLIDYLDIDYDYSFEFDTPVSGDYSYYFIATMSADRSTNGAGTGGNYWSREYALTEPVTGKVNNERTLDLDYHLKVDYQKYNKILADFKSTYSLAANGTLKVAMIIKGEIVNEKLDDPISLDTDLSLSVPLTEQSIEVTAATDTKENRHNITNHIDDDGPSYLTMRIVGAVACVGAIALAIVAFCLRRKLKHSTRYEDKVKKILSDYDSVIVDVDKQPKLTGVNVLTVNDFDELLDVYNSIHMPISFYRDGKSANFIIINEKMAWRYTISAKDFDEED